MINVSGIYSSLYHASRTLKPFLNFHFSNISMFIETAEIINAYSKISESRVGDEIPAFRKWTKIDLRNVGLLKLIMKSL